MSQPSTRLRSSTVVAMAMLLLATLVTPVWAHPEGRAHHNPLPAHATKTMRAFAQDQQSQYSGSGEYAQTCVNGKAGSFPCNEVDLQAFMPLADIGGGRSNDAANDIWGWTDPIGGKEYAIIGRVFGTSFVDISTPTAPRYLGELPTHGAFGSSWRDMKVYGNHAFIVSEALNHGMQVFDLTQLRNVTGGPVTFTETAHYSKVASAHNIAVNEDTGFAYIVGASGKNGCSGGLHMVDIRNVASPSFAGCVSADGYTHDTQCVVYDGPDGDHRGKEICFSSNEDTLTIVDVTNKAQPIQLSRTTYGGSAYTHQGWLTEDKTRFLLDDELDEQNFGHGTRTRVFNVADLDSPTFVKHFDSTAKAIDHNQYVRGNRVFQANYRAGLRILGLDDVANGNLAEVGFFDVYPTDDAPEFNGAWSTYPYFASGNVIISGIEQGLFVVKPSTTAAGVWDSGGGTGEEPPPPSGVALHVGDLDGSSAPAKGRKWDATVTATVHDAAHAPAAGATVTGTWSSGTSSSCTTGDSGTCQVTASASSKTTSLTFSVTGVTRNSDTYDSSANHDGDDPADSTGSSVTVSSP